jgi:hypothetical protein
MTAEWQPAVDKREAIGDWLAATDPGAPDFQRTRGGLDHDPAQALASPMLGEHGAVAVAPAGHMVCAASV